MTESMLLVRIRFKLKPALPDLCISCFVSHWAHCQVRARNEAQSRKKYAELNANTDKFFRASWCSFFFLFMKNKNENKKSKHVEMIMSM